MQCSKLYWPRMADRRRDDGSQALSCLQKAARVVESITDPVVQSELYNEMLSQLLFFAKNGATTITSGLIEHFGALAKKGILEREPEVINTVLQREQDR